MIRGLRANVAWELTRLRRSQRIFLLVIPAIAGPIGSAVADLFLRIPTPATAEVLGLLITAGLGALVVLDLTALAVGEDLQLRAHLSSLALPQSPSAVVAGRLLAASGASLAAFLLGGVEIFVVAPALVPVTPGAAAALFDPVHLYLGLAALLAALGGITAIAAVVTRSSSQALVAGVLAAVVVGAGASYLLLTRALDLRFVGGLVVVAAVGYGAAVARFGDAAR